MRVSWYRMVCLVIGVGVVATAATPGSMRAQNAVLCGIVRADTAMTLPGKNFMVTLPG